MINTRDAIKASTASPYEKHVAVLINASALCRELGGTIAILCKSGKDRTSMAVTLEQSKFLFEEVDALDGFSVCDLMRKYGSRRMNVYANTGQTKYAFNNLQVSILPYCYRPPPGSNKGSVST